MRRLAESAAVYGAAGWHVFPLIPGGKTPATLHGWKDATTDPETIRAWWDKNPGCNIGLACGASGLVAIDVDPEKGGWGTLLSLVQAGVDFPRTLSQITPSGGCHYLYRAPRWRLRNRAGKLPGISESTPGIDLRADGGYIVIPPSVTEVGEYEWLPPRLWAEEPVECPAWLQPARQTTFSVSVASVVAAVTEDGYGVAALEDECRKVATALVGTRNDQLNRAAFSLGTLIGAGALDAATVVTRLLAAGHQAGLGETEIRQTLKSGLTEGISHPRTVPT